MRKGWREVLNGLFLVSLSVLFTLGLAEGFLRIFPSLLPEEARLRIHWREIVSTGRAKIADHPYIGYLYPPNFKGRTYRGDFSFTYQTDGYGFRNPWPWPERAEIVAVGDSLAFGYGVDDKEAWTNLLAKRLPQSRVMNLGLIGASPPQYLRIYEAFGVKLHSKVLLFCLFPGNDLSGATEFDLWLKAGAESNYRMWLASRGESGMKKFLKDRIYVYAFLNETWLSYRSSRYLKKTIDFPDGSRLQLAPGILERAIRGAHPDHPDFQRVMQVIEKTKELTESNGTRLIVILFPSKEEVYLSVMGESSPDSIGPFRVEFEKRGISYLDLTPGLRQRAAKGEALFFEVDGHPNRHGYALISELIFSHLKENASKYGLKDWESISPD